jgi:hypothetical protein
LYRAISLADKTASSDLVRPGPKFLGKGKLAPFCIRSGGPIENQKMRLILFGLFQ